ncbi:hypothetical protein RF11_14046 [Thelohanellus kitauei]|uniref:RWD domain-containing protein n=1 Tax=Thelohanellus kitauei TaxID=669202 RepID=A0A0C2NBI7_THEKT|nr:hypothetical protein RF11_14046 [Thelohanellus kitauei]
MTLSGNPLSSRSLLKKRLYIFYPLFQKYHNIQRFTPPRCSTTISKRVCMRELGMVNWFDRFATYSCKKYTWEDEINALSLIYDDCCRISGDGGAIEIDLSAVKYYQENEFVSTVTLLLKKPSSYPSEPPIFKPIQSFNLYPILIRSCCERISKMCKILDKQPRCFNICMEYQKLLNESVDNLIAEVQRSQLYSAPCVVEEKQEDEIIFSVDAFHLWSKEFLSQIIDDTKSSGGDKLTGRQFFESLRSNKSDKDEIIKNEEEAVD